MEMYYHRLEKLRYTKLWKWRRLSCSFLSLAKAKEYRAPPFPILNRAIGAAQRERGRSNIVV